jgi:N-acetylglucosamine-6-phosphate deacetylase
MRILGRRYDNGQAVWIEMEGHAVADMGPLRGPEKGRLPWIAPGLVDLQVNGYGGREFTDPQLTVDDVERICLALDATGLTSLLPTVTTQQTDALIHSLQTIAQAIAERPEVAARVPGIHLEGPYISAEDGPRGAHPLEYCKPPDWDEFQRFCQAAGGHLRMLTMSPEYAGSAEFIRRAVGQGVLVAIGHTKASGQQIRSAVEAGARLSTHLGNGAHALIRRHPNYIWDQLAEDQLAASLILDGHHLPPSVVKCFLRVKAVENVVLISDITGLGGMPPGQYENWKQGPVEVLEDGRVQMVGQQQYLAGAALPLSDGVANLVRLTDTTLAAAIDMASSHPARLIGMPTRPLARAMVADLIQFQFDEPDESPCRLRVLATFNSGRCVYGEPVLDVPQEC